MKDIKEQLDKDVRLGVLEPVPVGQPVQWCSRPNHGIRCSAARAARNSAQPSGPRRPATQRTHSAASVPDVLGRLKNCFPWAPIAPWGDARARAASRTST